MRIRNKVGTLCFIMLVLTTHIVFPTYGQVKRPEIGEKFDYTFTNLINYSTPTAKVSDFKGKLLILDFWNTGCTSCIASWPKLLKLQEKFDDHIQFILINHLQDESVVRKTIARQKEINNVNMTLPIVCRDTLLGNQLFPFPGVPRITWIDEEGHFRSFTDGSYVNEATIYSILKKEQVSMQQLPSDLGKYIQSNYSGRSKLKDFGRPFFVNGNGEDSKYMPLITQSVMTGKIDGLLPILFRLTTDTSKSIQTLTMQGSIEMLYRVAYNNSNFDNNSDNSIKNSNLYRLMNNRVEWNVNNPNFSSTIATGTTYDFFYCYQLTSQTTTRERIQKILQLDLYKYFGLEAHLEKRRVKCLVLTAVDTALTIETAKRQYPPKEGYYTPHTIDRFIHYLSVTDLYYNSPYPIIDETGFKGMIGGFKLSKNHEELNIELQKCGLSFTLQEREIDVLVVTEPEGYVFPPELEYRNKIGEIEWEYLTAEEGQ